VEQQHRRSRVCRDLAGNSRHSESAKCQEKQEPLQRISAKCTVVTVGSAALSNSALSYTGTLGANDGVSLGHMGVGSRGTELDGMVARLNEQKSVR
jgi:hypothetical protein